MIPDKDKNYVKYDLEAGNDIFKYKERLITSLNLHNIDNN